MNQQEIQQAIETVQAGSNIVVQWSRPAKTRKAFNNLPVIKDVQMVARIGINYDNQNNVQEKRASGELPVENQGLQGEQYYVAFPYLICNPKNEKLFLRMYPATLKNMKAKTQFRIGNIPVKKEDISHMLLASETTSSSHTENMAFQVNIVNIKQIHEVKADSKNVAETIQETINMTTKFAEENEFGDVEQALQTINA